MFFEDIGLAFEWLLSNSACKKGKKSLDSICIKLASLHETVLHNTLPFTLLHCSECIAFFVGLISCSAKQLHAEAVWETVAPFQTPDLPRCGSDLSG